MTVFGKIMVFVNLALSLLMAIWAFGVWSNRIDFSDVQATAERAAGESRRRATEIDTLSKSLLTDRSGDLSNWARTREALLRQEQERQWARGWYLDELAKLAGTVPTDKPAQDVVYAAADSPAGTDPEVVVTRGQILLEKDDKGHVRPKLEDARDVAGNPAKFRALAPYVKEEEKTLEEVQKVQAKHEENIQAAIKLTQELAGTPADPVAGTKEVKGLQQRLIDERKKRADVEAEEGVIRPLLINAVVDLELVMKRQRSLLARIKELKNVGVAAWGR
jgi:hypothetical protein